MRKILVTLMIYLIAVLGLATLVALAAVAFGAGLVFLAIGLLASIAAALMKAIAPNRADA